MVFDVELDSYEVVSILCLRCWSATLLTDYAMLQGFNSLFEMLKLSYRRLSNCCGATVSILCLRCGLVLHAPPC